MDGLRDFNLDPYFVGKWDNAGARGGCIREEGQTREGARVATYKYIY